MTPALLPIVFAALAQPSLRGIGDLSGGGYYSEGYGVSGGGAVAVGGSIVGGSGFNQVFAALAFTGDFGTFSLYDSSGSGASAHATAASFDGQVVTGYCDHGAFSDLGIQAFIWTPQTGAVEVGDLPGGANGVPHSYGRAVSEDGAWAAVIGQSDRGDESYLYNILTGAMTPLGDLPGGNFGSYAYGMSRDGRWIVGVSYSGFGQEAFRWTLAGGMLPMGFLPTLSSQTKFSAAEAASTYGTVIVGESSSANTGGNGYEAFRWTASDGMQPLGDLPGGGFQSWAYAVSGDGSIVVGRGSIQGPCGLFGCGSAGRAFIWDAQHGMRNLMDVLGGLGVNLNGWVLTEARAISRDGSTIVGNGTNPQGQTEGWIAYIPPVRCAADLDDGSGTGTSDGGVTVEDLLFFLWVYAAGDLRADLDNGSGAGTRDGGVTVEDLLFFIAHFADGC